MSNSSAKIFSAIPITGVGYRQCFALCRFQNVQTRVTSGIMLALKLGLLIAVIVLSSTMLDINPSIECQGVLFGGGKSCDYSSA